jgi:hypothetical protein
LEEGRRNECMNEGRKEGRDLIGRMEGDGRKEEFLPEPSFVLPPFTNLPPFLY